MNLTITIAQFLANVHSSLTHVSGMALFEKPLQHSTPVALRRKLRFPVSRGTPVAGIPISKLVDLSRVELQKLLKIDDGMTRLVEDLLLRFHHIVLAR